MFAAAVLKSVLLFFSFPRFESVESNWLIENAEGALATGLAGDRASYNSA